MAIDAYSDGRAANADALRERSVGEHIFIWIGWALAAAFWGATMTTFFGIIRAVQQPTPGAMGATDAGGVGFLLMDVVGGLVVLGLAIAFGMFQFARRNRSLDPVTEASTARLYDIVERNGGEDLTTRSPEARTPDQRDAARPRGGA